MFPIHIMSIDDYILTVKKGDIKMISSEKESSKGAQHDSPPNILELQTLIHKIKSKLNELTSIMWTSSEILQKQIEISQFHQQTNKMMSEFMDNFYWYEKRHWRKFEPDQLAFDNELKRQQIDREKKRLAQWSQEVYATSDAHLFTKDHISENLISETLRQHGIKMHKETQILDVASGDGHWLRVFNEWGVNPEGLIGIDIDESVVEKARTLSDKRIRFFTSSFDEFPFEIQKFDIILAFDTLTYILDGHSSKKFAEQIMQRLSDNGVILSINLLPDEEPPLSYPLAYTMKGLGKKDLQSLFPNSSVDFIETPPYGAAVIRKRNLVKETRAL
jgi:SAM-dependent methyltransferase